MKQLSINLTQYLITLFSLFAFNESDCGKRIRKLGGRGLNSHSRFWPGTWPHTVVRHQPQGHFEACCGKTQSTHLRPTPAPGSPGPLPTHQLASYNSETPLAYQPASPTTGPAQASGLPGPCSQRSWDLDPFISEQPYPCACQDLVPPVCRRISALVALGPAARVPRAQH